MKDAKTSSKRNEDDGGSRYENTASFLMTCVCVVVYAKNNISLVPWLKKGKGFPFLLPSVGPGADPGVQAISLQVTISHPPGSKLPLLSGRLVVTFSAAEHHRFLAGTKLCCLVTETHRCKQRAQGCYAALPRVGFEPSQAKI